MASSITILVRKMKSSRL